MRTRSSAMPAQCPVCPKADTAGRFMSTRSKTIIAFLVAAAISLVDPPDSALAQALPCRSWEYAHNVYTAGEVDLAKHTVRLYWKRSDGTPYAHLFKASRYPRYRATAS
jgi:uncharacterized protein YigE (DUF2233 family)